MNVSFVNPLLLWGMLAAVLPLAIHLINRRKARRISFSATYFVSLTNRRIARALKLKQLILLVLRTMLLLILPIMFARPYQSPDLGTVGSDDTGPAARVILLDRSLSMQATLDGEILFDKAKHETIELLRRFGETDAVAVIALPPMNDSAHERLSFDRTESIEAVESMEASTEPARFSDALQKAGMLLEESPLQNKRLHIIGDFTRNGYERSFSIVAGDSPVAVLPLDIRARQKIPNAALRFIEAKPSLQTGNHDWEFRLSVINYSEEDLNDRSVRLKLDGEEIAAGSLDIPAGETTEKRFVLTIDKPGTAIVEARIEDDLLPADNSKSVIVDVGRNLHGLIVNGQPSMTRHMDEVFYLREALNPGSMGSSGISLDTITPELLLATDLKGYDLVYLCHVPEINEVGGALLESFVEQGGGLFISLGPHVDVDSYNRFLSDLLPGKLRGARAGGNAVDGKTEVFLSGLDYEIPAFRVFDNETAKSLYAAKVRGYMTYDPDGRPGKSILAKFSDSSPALVLTSHGAGRSLLFTSSVSRVWNDLPIQTGFLPMLQELSRMLAGELTENGPQKLKAGQRYRLGEEEKLISMQDPKGNVIAENGFEDGGLFTLPLTIPGAYRLQTGDGVKYLLVELDLAESDLAQLDEAEMVAATGLSSASITSRLPEGRREFGGQLAWLLLLILAAEVAMLRWMG